MPQLSYKKPSETANSNVTDIQQPKNSFLSLIFGYLRSAAAGVKRFCFVLFCFFFNPAVMESLFSLPENQEFRDLGLSSSFGNKLWLISKVLNTDPL